MNYFDDDDKHRAWEIILALYADFLKGWSPSTDEPGVLLRGSVPFTVIKRNSAQPVRIKRRGTTLH
jgi:hypothetical protein